MTRSRRRALARFVAIGLLLASESARFGVSEVRWGLVPDGQALAKARELAAQIAENGPLAVEAVLKTLHATDGMTEAEAMAFDMQVGLPIFQTRDAKEGPRAFAEKRRPQFTRS